MCGQNYNFNRSAFVGFIFELNDRVVVVVVVVAAAVTKFKIDVQLNSFH
jgi:hypothetical protein